MAKKKSDGIYEWFQEKRNALIKERENGKITNKEYQKQIQALKDSVDLKKMAHKKTNGGKHFRELTDAEKKAEERRQLILQRKRDQRDTGIYKKKK